MTSMKYMAVVMKIFGSLGISSICETKDCECFEEHNLVYIQIKAGLKRLIMILVHYGIKEGRENPG